MIKINMDKARDITADRLRKERAPLLESLDIEMMRALGAGDSKKVAEIESKKQELRDATKDKRIESAKRPQDLKKITLI